MLLLFDVVGLMMGGSILLVGFTGSCVCCCSFLVSILLLLLVVSGVLPTIFLAIFSLALLIMVLYGWKCLVLFLEMACSSLSSSSFLNKS